MAILDRRTRQGALGGLLIVALAEGGCGSFLPAVATVPTEQTSDWRMPATEWSALQEEIRRCHDHLESLGRRFSAQQQAYIAYNTMTAITGVAGVSTAIAGVLQAAGADADAVNKGIGIAGSILAAGGPILFGALSNQRNPIDLRGNFDKMNTVYTTVLHSRAMVLYCQEMVARTPEVVTPPNSSYPPEILAERARFQDNCAAYYAVPTSVDANASTKEPMPQGEPRENMEFRRRRARRIIDPEYQLTKLTEQLRLQCVESAATVTTLAAPTKQAPAN